MKRLVFVLLFLAVIVSGFDCFAADYTIAYQNNFNDTDIKKLSSVWKLSDSTAFSVENAGVGNNAINMKKSENGNGISATLPFAEQSGKVSVDMDLKIKDSKKAQWYSVYLGANNVCVAISGRMIKIHNGDNVESVAGPVPDDQWFKLKIVLNTYTKTFDLYVDYELVAKDHAFRSSTVKLNQLAFSFNEKTEGFLSFDNLTIKTTTAVAKSASISSTQTVVKNEVIERTLAPNLNMQTLPIVWDGYIEGGVLKNESNLKLALSSKIVLAIESGNKSVIGSKLQLFVNNKLGGDYLIKAHQVFGDITQNTAAKYDYDDSIYLSSLNISKDYSGKWCELDLSGAVAKNGMIIILLEFESGSGSVVFDSSEGIAKPIFSYENGEPVILDYAVVGSTLENISTKLANGDSIKIVSYGTDGLSFSNLAQNIKNISQSHVLYKHISTKDITNNSDLIKKGNIDIEKADLLIVNIPEIDNEIAKGIAETSKKYNVTNEIVFITDNKIETTERIFAVSPKENVLNSIFSLIDKNAQEKYINSNLTLASSPQYEKYMHEENQILSVFDDFDNRSEMSNGWTGSGNFVEYADGSGKYFEIEKMNPAGSVVARRELERLTGRVEVSYDLTIYNPNGWKSTPYILDSNNQCFISIVVEDGYLKAYNGAGLENMSRFIEGQSHRIKLVMDFDEDKFDVYMDNVIVGKGFAFRTIASDISVLQYSIGDKFTGYVMIDNLCVKTTTQELIEIKLDESNIKNIDFENMIIGSPVDNINKDLNEGSFINVSDNGMGGKAMQFYRAPGKSKFDTATLIFGKITGLNRMKFKIRTNNLSAGWQSIYIGNYTVCMAVQGANIIINNGTSVDYVAKLEAGKWYDIEFLLDTSATQFEMFVNGVKVKEKTPFRNNTNIDRIFFDAQGETSCDLMFDDLYIEKLPQIVIETKNLIANYYENTELDNKPLSDFERGSKKILYEYKDFKVDNYKKSEDGRGFEVDKRGIGTLEFVFEGESGYYQLHTDYWEKEGKYDSHFFLYHNGKQIDYWLGQYDDNITHSRISKEYWYVEKGDVFKLMGYYGKDNSCVERIVFVEPIVREVKRGMLIDDQYWQQGNLPASGWERDQSGGFARINGYLNQNPYVIKDVAKLEKVTTTRRIMPTKMDITFSQKLYFAQGDGVSFSLRNEDKPLAELILENGNLYANNGGEKIILKEGVPIGTLVGFKIIMHNNKKTADIYYNGTEGKVEGIPFINDADFADNYHIETSTEKTAHIALAGTQIHVGYIVFDDLLSTSGDSLSEGWNVTRGVAKSSQMNSNLYMDVSSFEVSGEIQKKFETVTKNLTFECEFIAPKHQDGVKVALGKLGEGEVAVVTSGKNLCYIDKNGKPQLLWANYFENMWYHIKVEINKDNNTASFYVNRILSAENVSLNLPDAFDCITLSNSGKENSYFDDVMLFEGFYESNVPDVKLPKYKKDDYLIGVQTCDLWREGHHFSYDALSPYDNRIPLLGYFEDGDPEVSDWETKQMLENGINLYVPCWYRPTVGVPVKEPRNAYKLHQGFMNSKFAPLMDFMIVFENGVGAKDSKDFLDNVVRYWIERYFKHPSYLVVDNKPVVAIWRTDQMDANFDLSSPQTFAMMEELVKQAGFDGVILIGHCAYTSSDKMSMTKSLGYEYSYNYNYGANKMPNQLLHQQKQKNLNVLPVIGAISQGWGDEPWGRNARKTNIPISQWHAGLEWLCDVYMPSYSEDNLASKMLLLGNWNEIAEGHVLLPTNIAGFKYLEEVRNVFTTGGEVQNIIPSASGFGAYDQLSPFLW